MNLNARFAFQTIVTLLLNACAADRHSADPADRGRPSMAGALVMAADSGAVAVPDARSGMWTQSMSQRPQAEASTTTARESCHALVQTAKLERQPVDVIFAIDTSGSMAEEIGFVRAQMNMFSKRVRESGIDIRVVMLASQGDTGSFGLETEGVCIDAPLGSGTCPVDSNPPAYFHIAEPVMQRNILDSYVTFYPKYKEHLRLGSIKNLVAVSDDDAQRIGLAGDPHARVEKFLSDMAALDPSSQLWSSWRYSAIYPFTECPSSFAVGVAHAELVKRTMGIGGDLCLQDFAPVFDAIANQLVQLSGLSCDWEIPPPPTGETFDAAKTNVELSLDGAAQTLLKTSTDCGARDAWHYDNDNTPTHVVACPATCERIRAAKRNAEVRVLFGCATQIIPD
jgi:hypothetical protein